MDNEFTPLKQSWSPQVSPHAILIHIRRVIKYQLSKPLKPIMYYVIFGLLVHCEVQILL